MARRETSRVSIRLMLSYVLDWIIIIGAAAIGVALGTISPNKRPISLSNPELSYPDNPDTVTIAVVIIVSLGAPAAIIFIVSLLLVPGPSVPKSVPKGLIWRRKLWEWFTGWLGLGMSCASSWLITSGLKNLVGKPRPDVIARCMPDLSQIAKYAVAGIPDVKGTTVTLVHAGICTNPDHSLLDDGWRSWPSGHSSFSAAGLVYLSLFLASKLALTLPFLSPKQPGQSDGSYYSAFPSYLPPASSGGYASKYDRDDAAQASNLDHRQIAARNQAASPPLYLLALAFIPTGAAMYIAASRYSDFRHHGFDILSGSFIGTVAAFAAFRYYHLPLSRGAGWSWGPRSRSRAFWTGVGTGGYVGGNEGKEAGEAVMMEDLSGQRTGYQEQGMDGAGDFNNPAGRGRDRDTVGAPVATAV
ncbi:hypothetical protein VE01_06628 [Pseudogymnoascus verrucosus]|uniref:Phosphatidic acid phosphatase type 2/haloperoxidase domain-containing protein n=1 Tax=Pseudogymnoascus verrucosus TaxID=342668 RepID=A0A1B8GHI2_9PEZI|nr:uncharacterized protein VE01_06628 [Pseudogymnoascus verrucosus]OBT95300.1 hypothetical protein VE01_06628 [Pseudogymnoascus verrucosus]